MVLWAPEFVAIFATGLPVPAFSTFQCGPSNDGTYSVAPSGEIASRSQPPSGALSHTILSVPRSMQHRRRMLVT